MAIVCEIRKHTTVSPIELRELFTGSTVVFGDECTINILGRKWEWLETNRKGIVFKHRDAYVTMPYDHLVDVVYNKGCFYSKNIKCE